MKMLDFILMVAFTAILLAGFITACERENEIEAIAQSQLSYQLEVSKNAR